jgi:Tol biopolymer transport system component
MWRASHWSRCALVVLAVVVGLLTASGAAPALAHRDRVACRLAISTQLGRPTGWLAASRPVPLGVSLVKFRADGSGAVVPLVDIPSTFASLPDWSPDGRSIAFVISGSDDPSVPDGIHVVRPDGSDRRFLVDGSSPTWSPDGQDLAFIAEDEQIWTVDASGADLHPLTHGSRSYFSPDWAWGGQGLVAVGAGPSGHSRVYLIDPILGTPTLVPGTNGALSVAWAPDGDRLAVSGFLKGTDLSAIWIVRPNGEGLRRVTTPSVGDDSPTWSPDGLWIAFDRGSGPHVYTVRLDGSGLRRVRSRASSPDWRS